MRVRAAVISTALLFATGGVPAHAAEDGKVSAIAVWEGEGATVRVGEKEAMIIGTLEGLMFIVNNKGPLHMAKMTCPLTGIVTPGGATTAEGRCLISDAAGDLVFAQWTCKGVYLEGCSGEFKLNGGTGKFKGITGASTFVFRSAMHEYISDEVGVLNRKAIGLATWAEIKYRIP